jgi:hypothetical protein
MSKLLVVSLLFTACALASYSYTGINVDVPMTNIVGNGWSVCHDEFYGLYSYPLANVAADCPGDNLMLVCYAVGSSNFHLAAYGKIY